MGPSRQPVPKGSRPPSMEQLIQKLAAERGVMDRAALDRARAFAIKGDVKRARYWLRKAYKLNTEAGIKQLFRGAVQSLEGAFAKELAREEAPGSNAEPAAEEAPPPAEGLFDVDADVPHPTWKETCGEKELT